MLLNERMDESPVGLPLDYVNSNNLGKLIVPIALRGNIPIKSAKTIPTYHECVFRPIEVFEAIRPTEVFQAKEVLIQNTLCSHSLSKPSVSWYKKLWGFITIEKPLCSAIKKKKRKFYLSFNLLVKIMQKMFSPFRKKRGKHNDATEACMMKVQQEFSNCLSDN